MQLEPTRPGEDTDRPSCIVGDEDTDEAGEWLADVRAVEQVEFEDDDRDDIEDDDDDESDADDTNVTMDGENCWLIVGEPSALGWLSELVEEEDDEVELTDERPRATGCFTIVPTRCLSEAGWLEVGAGEADVEEEEEDDDDRQLVEGWSAGWLLMMRHDDRLLSFWRLLGDRLASKLNWLAIELVFVGAVRLAVLVLVVVELTPLVCRFCCCAWLSIRDKLNVGWPVGSTLIVRGADVELSGGSRAVGWVS